MFGAQAESVAFGQNQPEKTRNSLFSHNAISRERNIVRSWLTAHFNHNMDFLLRDLIIKTQKWTEMAEICKKA